MRICEKCGSTFDADYAFCPECGGKTIDLISMPDENNPGQQAGACDPNAAQGGIYDQSMEQQTGAYSSYDPGQQAGAYYGPNAAQGGVYEDAGIYADLGYGSAGAAVVLAKKQFNIKKFIIIASIAIAVIAVIVIVLLWITTPRQLRINGGKTFEMWVGETKTLTLEGDYLDAEDKKNATYKTTGTVVTCIDGVVKNKYNKSLFNTYGTQYKMAHYQTTIDVEIKSGLRTWIGKQKVVVKLKPVRVKNGKVFKRPKGKSISSIRVKGNKYQNTYIYLKSKKSRKNDLAFIVLANKDVFIKNVPLNKYVIYMAQGDTWYGTKYLFGPGSRKIKDRKTYDFSRYKWTFNLRSKKKGNMRTDTVEDKDFPR